MISSLVPLWGLQYSFTFITMSTIFFYLPTSSGVHGSYKVCSSSASCGKVGNIGYPFWGVGDRPQECGIQNQVFKLKCPSNDSDDYPVLQLNDKYDKESLPPSYQVLRINSPTNTIKLQAQYPPLTNCSIPLHESVFSGRPFKYSSRFEMIHLLECNHSIGHHYNQSVACLNSQTNVILRYYYLQNSLDYIPSYESSCKRIPVPVLKKELQDLKERNRTLDNVLKKGFKVGYLEVYFKACLLCQGSGGTCGSAGDHPSVCFCKNRHQPYLSTCPGKLDRIREIAIPVGLFLLVALIIAVLCWKKGQFHLQTFASRLLPYHLLKSDLGIGNSFFGIPLFSYKELQESTNNFDPERVLGDGAFGVVYHGKLRDGREVAVKRLYEKNYRRVGQFMNEIEILTKLSHPNLVTLYGCTSRHSRELLLVYEYISNGTVANHLYRNQSQSRSLTWAIRMKIAVETAGALSYLHAANIVHRDVKTTNILLEKNFTVKVADLGLSRLFPFDATHLSTAPQGTLGYLDPEYHKHYQVTNKSDVYSFGVVLIELISSLPAIDTNRNEDEINLSTYAMNKIQHGKLADLVDQKLGFDSDFKVTRMVTLVAELAFQCLQQGKEVRPSMEEVLEALRQIENVDYEAFELEGLGWDFRIPKPATAVAENEVEQPTVDAQNQSSSPKSEIESWLSRSTASNTSG